MPMDSGSESESEEQKRSEYLGLIKLKLEQANRYWLNDEVDHATFATISVKNLLSLIQASEDVP